MKELKMVKCNDVIDVRDGTHDSPKYVENGYPLVTSKNLINGKLSLIEVSFITKNDFEKINKRSKVDKGDILYSMIGSIGNYALIEEEPNFAIKNVALFKFNNDLIFNRYFYHLLNSSGIKSQIENQQKGGTQKFVSLTILRNLQIPLPPLPTQRHIAAILDEADKLRQLNKQLIDKYDALSQSLFLDMFGDPVVNPKGWKIKKLNNVCTKIGSGATPRGGKEAYYTEGISLIRSLNVHDNKFKYKDLAFINNNQAEKLKNVAIESKDVLFNITGASVCRCCVVPNNILPARVNQHVSILRTNKEILNELYLSNALISENCKIELLGIGTQGGATREAITKEALQNFKLAIPPIDLQNLFAARIQAIEAQKAQAQQALAKSEELFGSLLQGAFSAKLG